MKKIAVMLPHIYRGGSLRAAKNVARSLAFQSREHGDDIQVIFSYVKAGKYNIFTEFDDLMKAGILLRETVWKVYAKESLQAATSLIDLRKTSLEYQEYCLPSDGANDFYDCDLWLIISDRLPAPLFPLRKYAFVVYDYIQRYVPEIFGNSDTVWDNQVSNLIHSVQRASKVFVTTPSTQQDLISYAGVDPSRTQLLEMEFQPLEAGSIDIDSDIPKNYVVWPTNTTHHKNHVNAFDAIELYIEELGGSLHFLITGESTEYFDPTNEFPEKEIAMQAQHIQYLRKKIKKNARLAERLHIMGKVSDKRYACLLKHAHFLWHPTLYDNGTFAVLEAAYLGTPSLSARYPAMVYINQKFKLNMQFFDPRNPNEMAEALFNMETAAASIPLPDQNALSQYDWKALSLPLYQAISTLLW